MKSNTRVAASSHTHVTETNAYSKSKIWCREWKWESLLPIKFTISPRAELNYAHWIGKKHIGTSSWNACIDLAGRVPLTECVFILGAVYGSVYQCSVQWWMWMQPAATARRCHRVPAGFLTHPLPYCENSRFVSAWMVVMVSCQCCPYVRTPSIRQQHFLAITCESKS